MTLQDDVVLLRDFKREDIAKRIEWETEKTEWQLWDAPWEYEGLTEEQKKEDLQKYIKALEEWAAMCESLSDEMPRKSFQICTPEGEYVGWCGSYFIRRRSQLSGWLRSRWKATACCKAVCCRILDLCTFRRMSNRITPVSCSGF